jgi:hypothetical protein
VNNDVPFLLLRARTKGGDPSGFDAWFHQAHLRDVRQIPGIVAARGGRTAGGTYLGVYTLADASVVRSVLDSPEAAYARGTWEQWAGDLEELLIEMWAPAFPLAQYASAN